MSDIMREFAGCGPVCMPLGGHRLYGLGPDGQDFWPLHEQMWAIREGLA